MKTAKIGVVFLVSVMAFAAIGASLAHWEETLTISGVMTTDDIDPVFECDQSNDPFGSAAGARVQSLDPTACGTWNGGQWSGDRRDKDVGWMETFIPAGGKSIEITVGDAYPCFYSHAYWCTKNYGSCPVLIHSIKLTELSIDPTPEDDEDSNVVIPVDVDMTTGHTYYVDYWQRASDDAWRANVVVDDDANAEKYDFSLTPTGEWGEAQLDPISWQQQGSVSTHMEDTDAYTPQLDHDLCIHFENGCRQSFKYDFKIDMTFYNWPEYANT